MPVMWRNFFLICFLWIPGCAASWMALFGILGSLSALVSSPALATLSTVPVLMGLGALAVSIVFINAALWFNEKYIPVGSRVL